MLEILVQSIVIVVFVNRYIVGTFLRLLKGVSFDETVEGYEPTVTIIIPMFNEGSSIVGTIHSLLQQDYPSAKLEILVVDDCSTDDSYHHASCVAKDNARVNVMRNAQNMGKRKSINRAVRSSQAEIIISVDSDVVLKNDAVLQLIRRFTSDNIAAVGGRVRILNHSENWLTKMQAIKYYIGYEYLKNIERAFKSVLCLSGCLTAYRRSVLMELEPILEDRNILGQPIKYGEDRFLTRQIIKAGYQTTLTLDAVCWTQAPSNLLHYFSQQLRWRRSNIVDYVAGMSHGWKLHPIVAIHYFSLFALLILYPIIIVAHLARGSFWPLMMIHIGVVGVFGALYQWKHRNQAREVAGIWFLHIAFVMPITYVLLTPLALFTLDSGDWETRGHTTTNDAFTDTPATANKAVVVSSTDKPLSPLTTIPAMGNLRQSSRNIDKLRIAS